MEKLNLVLSIAALLCWCGVGIMSFYDIHVSNKEISKMDYWFAWALALLGLIGGLADVWVR